MVAWYNNAAACTLSELVRKVVFGIAVVPFVLLGDFTTNIQQRYHPKSLPDRAGLHAADDAACCSAQA